MQDESIIVLVGGLPGSGKTYFAKKLAGRIGGSYLSTDVFRNVLQARGKYGIDDKLLIYDALVKTAESKLLSSLHPVIVDATFSRRAMREPFVMLARKIAIPLKLIWIYADEQLIRERTGKPREDSEADYSVYLNIRDQLEPPEMPHLAIESTRDNIEAMLTKAIAYIFSDAAN